MSFCVISDTTDHVADTVHAFQEKLMKIIKEEYPWIKNVIYFSDGAPTKYKNKNNLANVCCHEQDFGIKVTSYNFFATSHGKSVCDGTGGTIKRKVMRHCIRSSPDQQVTTPLEFYEYVFREMKNIRAIWVSDAEVQKHKKKLKKRFDTVKTIKDTRMNHSFTPINNNSMEVRMTSFDKDCKVVKVNL
ncbi:uncharacterized protein LOC123273063 [Cotesia glomerata]|uniref:uncharacterized protein LOC123273063 n=1 Tax=Cotesia glomerata TaxID=32391 RepID=UPI001D0113CB|nr:uncharacterized protein LOC123273063 [Cotesia glomerata]